MKRFFRFLKHTIEKPGIMKAKKEIIPATALVIAAMDVLLLIQAFILEKSFDGFAGQTLLMLLAVIFSWFLILFSWYLVNEQEDGE